MFGDILSSLLKLLFIIRL